MTQHTPAEMREMALWMQEEATAQYRLGKRGRAKKFRQAAQMLMLSATTFERSEKATRAFTEKDLATFAAMQGKGE